MIELFAEKKDCCGCGACMNICPKTAIHMGKDEYGFVYPKIDTEKCVECGACKQVCAFQNEPTRRQPQRVYAIVSKNNDLVKKSASGGLFGTMAVQVLEQGGCVYGAVMQHEEHELHIRHVCCETKAELYHLQGSKYVQSSLGNIFKDVQKKLKNDIFVLFSGTPCQVDALKSYLRKDYPNLLTVDIICHGVPSEQFFNDYIHYTEKKIGGEISEFKFRDKSAGWGLNAKVKYTNDKGENADYSVSYLDSSYYDLFLSAKIYRENCYKCPYATSNRCGDITIGDYWGIEDEHPETLEQNGGRLSEKNGISVSLINSDKGIAFFDEIKEQFDYYESTFEKAAKRNTQLVHPVKLTKARKKVLEMYRKWGYGTVEFYFWCRIPKQKAKSIVRRVLPKETRQKIKQLLHK